jgi:hypothetical protein
MGKKKVKIPIRDEQPESYFRELRNYYFGLKYLNSLMRIREPGWKKFGSGINIQDPQHCYTEVRMRVWSKDAASCLKVRVESRQRRVS